MKELSQLRKHIAYSYLPRVLNLIIVPFQISILTNNLSVGEYGVLTLIQSSLIMLTFIFTFGIQKFISIVIPGNNLVKQYKYFKSLYFFEFILYTISILIFYQFIDSILEFFKILNYKHEINIFLCVYFFSLAYNELGRFLNYQRKIGLRVFLTIIEKVIELLMLYIVIVIFRKNNLENIAYTYLILYVFLWSIYMIFAIKFKLFIHVKINKKILKIAFLFGLGVLVSDISWRLIQNINYYFLAYMNLKDELGIYSFIYRLINYIYLSASPIIWVLYPYITSAYNSYTLPILQNKKVLFFIDKQYKYTFSFLLFTLGVLLINLNFFVVLIANKSFLQYKNLYLLFSIYPILLAIMYIQQQSLLITKHIKKISIIYFYGLISLIVYNFLFLNYRIYGSVFSLLLSVATIVGLQVKYSSMISKKILYFIILNYLLTFLIMNLEMNSIFKNSIYIIFYILMLIYFDFLSKKELNIILNKIGIKF